MNKILLAVLIACAVSGCSKPEEKTLTAAELMKDQAAFDSAKDFCEKDMVSLENTPRCANYATARNTKFQIKQFCYRGGALDQECADKRINKMN